MKVSIITSCYNREATIRGAIESVLEQDYPYIEYIVVDGASKDNSLGNFMSPIRIQYNMSRFAFLIIMNILASSKSPITLLEMGLHMRSGKLHVICEPGFYRYDNVRITCNRYGVPLYHSMDEFLKTVR